MPLPRKLTAAEIPTLKEGTYKDQSGVTLRVLPSGTRSWVLAYKSPITKKTRRISFGIFPQITLADARTAVAEARIKLAKGIDPQEDKDADRAALTVLQALDKYRTLYLSQLKTGSDVYRDLHRLLKDKHNMPVTSLGKADINRILNGYRAKGQLPALKRNFGLMNAFFTACVEQQIMQSRPTADINLSKAEKRQNQRDRVLSLDELGRIWRACDSLTDPQRRAIRTLILTGQRKNEVCRLRREEVAGSVWTQLDNKASRKHTVHLSGLCLKQITSSNTSPFVFSTTLGKKPMNLIGTIKAKLDDLSGVESWVWHDIRRSFATGLAELRYPDYVITACLNHSMRSVTSIYQRSTREEEKIEAWEAWSQVIENIAVITPETSHT